ncbi:sorting nexin-5 [Eurytemora carolleeae]|uniref:sorting nexin-5 n=1 Tax=Eurytemora carolleeae TaxID=1294199 RepID=UPI000C758454|nr:sorting nexin-5 [Eurytemora carolleeae]XP_023345393.1 sorting nexin-5 [Eurytemora carolleeae]|eukprot:XP_023345391.1 sorting nexin-5-like [Eurytemora affinis]
MMAENDETLTDPLSLDNLDKLDRLHLEVEEVEDRSSSTEGPDSPGYSASSSPVPMMLPSSPTHLDYKPPRYSVRFTDNVTKDGDILKYTINVRKLYGYGDIKTITREYDDLAYLDHQLLTNNRKPGLIFPPLPSRPLTDPASAESRSRKQLGSSNRSIIGDASQWSKDCRALERYLEMVVSHPIIGKDSSLSEFLERQDPPPRPSKLKKGWLSGVKDKWDSRHSAAKDCDEWFGKEREWATVYSSNIKDTSEKFQQMVSARLRLIQQMGHLAASLNITVAGNEGANGLYNKLNSGFSGCVETMKTGLENEVAAEEVSLGSYLEQYSRCVEAENSMLLRRTSLMVEAESAARGVEKAKPNREEAAKLIRDEAEREFVECSELAKSEITAFHSKRIQDFKLALLHYVEGQIKCARENYKASAQCLETMKKFPINKVETVDPNHNS